MLSEILKGAYNIEPVQSRVPNKGFLFEKNLDFLITQEQKWGTRGGATGQLLEYWFLS